MSKKTIKKIIPIISILLIVGIWYVWNSSKISTHDYTDSRTIEEGEFVFYGSTFSSPKNTWSITWTSSSFTHLAVFLIDQCNFQAFYNDMSYQSLKNYGNKPNGEVSIEYNDYKDEACNVGEDFNIIIVFQAQSGNGQIHINFVETY